MTIETYERQKNREQEPAPSFVLSWDIELLMDSLCAEKAWKLPTAETFDRAKSKLVGALSAAFGDTPAVVIEGADIAKGINDAAVTLKTQNIPWIRSMERPSPIMRSIPQEG